MEDGESRNTLDGIAVGVEIVSVGELEVIEFSDKGTPPPEEAEWWMGSVGGVSGAYHPPCVLVEDRAGGGA